MSQFSDRAARTKESHGHVTMSRGVMRNRRHRQALRWTEPLERRLFLSASVVGRYVFYNNSAWDGNSLNVNAADDQAIATDKQALLGATSAFQNYTSFSKGINGIMVDIAGLTGTPTAADFALRMGNNNNPATWCAAPAPSAVVVRPGAGAGGSARVELTWPDNAIQNAWLEVTVRKTAATGLATPDVFFFGNAIGESGDSAANAFVNATDEIAARNDPHNFLNPAHVDNTHDYNRDKKVDATDQIIARHNGTNFLTALRLVSVPNHHVNTVTISWINPAGGDWNNPANWDAGRVPNATDNVSIATAGSAVITYSTGDTAIFSLHSTHPLTITGGTLTALDTMQVDGAFILRGGTLQNATVLPGAGGLGITVPAGASANLVGVTLTADLTIAAGGALTATGVTTESGHLATAGTLIATGPCGGFTATGVTNVDGATLKATAGGMLLLPITSYANAATAPSPGIQADGVGSVVDLPNLANLSAAQGMFVWASNGGRVNLSALHSVTTGKFNFIADGAGSVLSLPALTALTPDQSSILTVKNHGTVQDPLLTTIANTDITLDDTATLATGQISSYTNGAFSVSGAAANPDLHGLTDVSGAGFIARAGAHLLVPVASYTNNRTGSAAIIQADGTGSLVDLPNLAMITAPRGVYIWATNGGRVRVPAVHALTTGSFNLNADGIGSVLEVPQLATMTPDAHSNLSAKNGGTVQESLLSTISGTDVTLDSASQLSTAQITSYTLGAFSVSGAAAAPDLHALTNIASASFYARAGAHVTLPNTSYANNAAFAPTLEADGVGSVLEMTNLATLNLPRGVYIWATGGGRVKAPGVHSITGGSINLTADGAGSVLELPNLATLTPDSNSVLAARNGGAIQNPLLVTVGNTAVSVDATSMLATGQITSFTNSSFSASGAASAPDLHGLTDIAGSSFTAHLAAHVTVLVSTYTNTSSFAPTLEAEGVGSVLNLPNLATLNTPRGVYIWAISGGDVKLPVLHGMSAGGVNFSADGTGSVLELPTLASLTPNQTTNLAAKNGGAVQDPVLTTISGTDIFLDGASSLGTSQLTSYTGGTFTASGAAAAPDLHNLMSINSAGFIARAGAHLTVPAGTYSNSANFAPALEADGAGSVLDLPNLATFTTPRGVYIWAITGGRVRLPSLHALTSGSYNINADGAGSVLEMTSLANYAPDLSSVLTIRNGGAVNTIAGGTFNVGNVTITFNAGTLNTGTLNLASTATLVGTGTLAANLVNGGKLYVAGSGTAGAFTVGGNYTQTSAGTLYVDLAALAATQYDRVNVTGSATLDGTLNLALLNGFHPAAGSAFQILVAGSRSGTFATIAHQNPNDGINFNLTYTATTVVATAL